jgi:hypothetical protein
MPTNAATLSKMILAPMTMTPVPDITPIRPLPWTAIGSAQRSRSASLPRTTATQSRPSRYMPSD